MRGARWQILAVGFDPGATGMTEGERQASGAGQEATAARPPAERGAHLLWIASILALSVGLRLAAALYLGNTVQQLPGTADQLSYHTLALRLLGGHGFTFGEPWWPATRANAPTAHWSYLYTYFLAVVYAIFGAAPLAARLLQACFVGVVQPLLAFRLGTDAFGRRAGVVAAGLTAIYAYSIYYAPVLMTEAFYICSVLACLALAIQLSGQDSMPKARTTKAWFALAVGLGACLAVAVLLRQVFLLFVPFLALWVLLAGRGRFPGRIRTAWLLISLCVLVAVILPVTAFNTARFGTPVLLNTNSGFAFYWANHPVHGGRFNPILPEELGSYGELIPPELSQLNEAELDRELLRRGMGFVMDDPLRYISLSLTRVPAYFMFWPSSGSSAGSNLARVASFGLLWPLMLFGLVTAFLGPHRRPGGLASPAGLLGLFVLIYTAIHLLSWALVRYRLPVDAVLLVFAAGGIDILDRGFAQWKASRRPSGATTAASMEKDTRWTS